MAEAKKDEGVEKVSVPQSLEDDKKAEKTTEVKVHGRKGVEMTWGKDQDFWVQPESVPVWLDKGAQVK